MDLVQSQQGTQGGNVACHILPFSLNDFEEDTDSEVTSDHSFLFHKILTSFPRKRQ